VTPCSVVVGYRRFRGPFCFHFLASGAMKRCGRIPTFRRSMLPPSSRLWCNVVLWFDTNVSEVHAAFVFLLLVPCNVVVGYRRFGVPSCHLLEVNPFRNQLKSMRISGVRPDVLKYVP
jgi:hypothetical protein